VEKYYYLIRRRRKTPKYKWKATCPNRYRREAIPLQAVKEENKEKEQQDRQTEKTGKE
jgi:hypothetical protein